ncbi:MAG TPA: molybdopterin-dependent oxidoreductase, partial [Planctomycetota bacterium]|nr:molybdopterin-dependent oxidoreductase [Planctomycetota bacterium]
VPADAVDELFGRAGLVVALDALVTPTTERADVALPAATFAEGDGTLVSSEGRAQRFFQALVPEGDVQESWRWLRDLARAAGREAMSGWERLDDVTAALAAAVPELARVTECAPPAWFRILDQKIPRQPPRASGRTAIAAHRTVHEPRPPDDPDAPLAFSMEGYGGPPPPPLLAYVWAPGWNSEQAIHKFQSEADGPLAGGDPGVRLLEPGPPGGAPWRLDGGPPFRRSEGKWFFVPVAHVFGSEELSARGPAVRERIPRAAIVLGAADAERLRAVSGTAVEVRLPGFAGRLPLEVRPEWPEGVAGFPAGFPGMPGVELPAWGAIRGPA